MNDVTLCLAYYENPEMLLRQMTALEALPMALRDRIGLIVVDDGSPLAPAREVLTREWADRDPSQGGLGGRVKLFRMDIDVRWNQDACRNLAVTHAETKWMLLTDVDHIVPEATWRRIITGRLSWKSVYTFARLTGPTLSHRNPHPNSWLITRETFNSMGGYDERFAGYYGTDGDFKRRLQAVARIEQLPERLHEITPDMVADCRTTAYERKTVEDREAIPRLLADRKAAGGAIQRGRFPWHRVI